MTSPKRTRSSKLPDGSAENPGNAQLSDPIFLTQPKKIIPNNPSASTDVSPKKTICS